MNKLLLTLVVILIGSISYGQNTYHSIMENVDRIDTLIFADSISKSTIEESLSTIKGKLTKNRKRKESRAISEYISATRNVILIRNSPSYGKAIAKQGEVQAYEIYIKAKGEMDYRFRKKTSQAR